MPADGAADGLPRETWLRLLVKTVEWRLTGFVLGVVVGYALTDSWSLGAAFGGIYNLVRMGLMPIRDRIWGRIRWGVARPKQG